MLTNDQKNKVLEVFDSFDDSDQQYWWDEFCICFTRIEDYVYDMDELEDVLIGWTIRKALDNLDPNFSIKDDYFIINSKGHLVSGDYIKDLVDFDDYDFLDWLSDKIEYPSDDDTDESTAE